MTRAVRFVFSLVDAWIDLAVLRPYVMLGIWLFLLGAAAIGLTRGRVETSGESLLDKSSSDWSFYQQSIATFGNDEVIVAAIAGKSPYDLAALRIVSDVSAALEGTPGVRRVDSLSTLPIIEVLADGTVRLEPALDPTAVLNETVRSDVRRRVSGDRIAPGTIVSNDGTVLAVNVWPDQGIEESYEQLIERIRRVVGSPQSWVSGVPVFRTETNLRTSRELGTFVPVTIGVMVVLLLACFRSARGVVVPLTVSFASVFLLGGLMGWVGVPISAPTMILPPILLAMGCAYTMHLLAEVEYEAASNELRHAIKEVSRPLVLSGVTTAIGFASASIVPIEAVQRVGVLGAVGTLAACAATLGIGGAIVSLWPTESSTAGVFAWVRTRLAPQLLHWIRGNSVGTIAFWALVLALGVAGALRLKVESDVVLWFPRGSEVRDAYEEIKARLSGISPLNVVIRSVDGESVARPDVIAAIDKLSHYLASLPEMGKVVSVADPLRELQEGFGNQEAVLPTDRNTIEQYLLLLEGTDRLDDVITRDRSAANVLLRVNDNGSRQLLDTASRAEQWWQAHGVDGFAAKTTGSMYEVARAEEAIARGQVQGLGLDVAIIALILLIALRSVRLALIALVPNLLPIGLMFGFMGYSGIPVDLGTVFLSNLAVGIAVDETIHMVTAFARMRGLGWSSEKALDKAMRGVVPALVLTTVVVAGGFLVLGLSDFRFTRNLGFLTAGVMVLCVAANATLLPALLLRFASSDHRSIPLGATSS